MNSREIPIFFYRGEHLAVRNAEGGFFICQTHQNVYKTSKKITIQWLGQSKEDDAPKDVYIPEYYDKTGGCHLLSSPSYWPLLTM